MNIDVRNDLYPIVDICGIVEIVDECWLCQINILYDYYKTNKSIKFDNRCISSK